MYRSSPAQLHARRGVLETSRDDRAWRAGLHSSRRPAAGGDRVADAQAAGGVDPAGATADIPGELGAGGSGPHDWPRQVRAARDELDEVTAAALALVYERAATQTEVAAALGLEPAQVNSVIARGLLRLAAILFPAPLR
jgi:DNA-directed RNA polymerase specialized sigma24 family protein